MNAAMAVSPSSDCDRPKTRRLTWAYIAALSAVALLTIVGQISVQRSLALQRRSSTVVNIAGRQRMLSQKLTKTALLVAQANTSTQREARARELVAIAQQWQLAHQGLQQGNAELELPGINSEAVQTLFAQLEPHHQAMLTGVEQVASGPRPEAGVALLLAHEPAFLDQMEAIVFQYDREAQAVVARLQWQERTLLAIMLCVLLAEGLLIFRPAVAQIHSAMAQLAAAKQAAEAANAEKSRFLARVSHELRTPLNAIVGLTEAPLLPSAEVQQSAGMRHLHTIHDAAEALLRLVDDLLDVARVEEGGELSIHLAPMRLHDVLQRAMRLCHEPATRKGLDLTCDYDDAIPELVLCDAGRLQQVVINLLGNAIKFTDAGSVCVNANLLERNEQRCVVELSVKDTGVGIPAVDRERIFESFTQLTHPGHVKQEGIGLGLSIVARLVEGLGGQISVHSEIAQGSAFTIRLPLQIVVELPAPGSASITALVPAKHVLVIEDTPANQIVACELIGALGHHCEIAGTAAAGLAAAARQPFDCILIDLELPDASGLEIVGKLRKLPGYAYIPMVAVTAHALVEYRAQAAAVGFTEFVTKPVRIARLAEVLGNAATDERQVAALERWQTRPELLQSLIRLFCQERPKLLATIDVALASADAQQVRFFAHRLKGMTSNFGDQQTERLAGELEQVAERGDLTAAAALRGALAAALMRLERQLVAHSESLAKTT